jgi:molybdopterin-guanine dinucleotide biosynthesis protein A
MPGRRENPSACPPDGEFGTIPHRTNSTLAVLAGGAGTRMGRSKALLTLGGRPILEALLDNYAWTGPTLLVTAPGRERPPGAEHFDREVVDSIADGGPMLGICTAMEHLRTELLVVATVDMPGVGRGQLEWLMRNLEPGELGTMGSRIIEGNVQIEPFPSIFRATAAEPLRAHFDSGRRSVHSILGDSRFVAKATPADWPATVWANLNYPADVEAFDKSPPRSKGT